MPVARLSALTVGLTLILAGLVWMFITGEPHKTADIPAPVQNDILNGLFPGGKPVGQPYSRYEPEIRVMPAGSYDEALCWFYGVFDTVRQERHPVSGQIYHIFFCGDGFLLFTGTTRNSDREMAVMYVFSESLAEVGIREIRFIETVKIGRNYRSE